MTQKDSSTRVAQTRPVPTPAATAGTVTPTPHSPLPWYRGIETDIVDAGGFIIATADDDNARLIIAACNAHHDLLAALKDVLELHSGDLEYKSPLWYRRAKAVVAKAEGQK